MFLIGILITREIVELVVKFKKKDVHLKDKKSGILHFWRLKKNINSSFLFLSVSCTFAAVLENLIITVLNSMSNTVSLRTVFLDFKEITKAGLAISVLFSAIAGYFLGFDSEHPFQWSVLIMLAIGGYCMVGASNAFNQVIEKDLDSLMDRTKNRPVPAGRMSPTSALVVAGLLTIIGITLLYMINPKTAMFGAISIFLYTSVYTPLKTMTSLSAAITGTPC